ncbi:PAS domain S-box protein [Pedobacter sp. MC2016-14]|uniref:ATP-binding protein n=1 Tax=Pedobacter sp. MC2016-14 TaxID=2897327 RepID=UPI001E3BA08D|nr:ATP-binding protein [Pedobacter sp. MC2016-14]MCD0487614.1 PAS domain S-box protein [Pedobacter sp. MC2016-14]
MRIDSLLQLHSIRQQQTKTWFQFTVPLFLAIIATWVTLNPLFEVNYRTPFLLYFAVIFLSAFFGGSRSSLIATLSSVVLSLLFILPRYQPSSEVFVMATLIFFIEGLLLSHLFNRIERAQSDLRDSEQRFRGIIEKSAEGVVMTDRDGKIEYLSPSVSEAISSPEGSIIGTPISNFIHADETSFREKLVSLKQGRISEFDFLTRLKTADERFVWIEGTAMNLLQEKSIGTLVFQYRDVSSRVELEMQKDDFLHLASHELKTPITSIKGFIQVLKKRQLKENRGDDTAMLERIEHQVEKLVKLVNDLLDMTRIKNGEMSYHFEVIDFNEYITKLFDNYKNTFPDHDFIINFSGQTSVYADRERIAQVISNLINNAIKYSPGKTRIEVTVGFIDGFLRTSIKDQGIGIPQDQQQKIFKRFHRFLQPTKTTFNGLGIGLYVSREIVKTHKGQMGVISEVGEGADFWFELPLFI